MARRLRERQVTDSVTGPGSSFRTGRTPRLIRSSDPDVCLVGVLVEGDVRVEQDGRQAVLRPGDLSFIDPARPVRVRAGDRQRLGPPEAAGAVPSGPA
ncbi:hypothetical protein [Nonomuraea sp. NPDC049709]|uniref:AraC-like ligand-binding domain-containing protein n=1 Tax=Nonomuraea sp. NPDC049709 TaxID=3154736 RepID=UPI0034355C85